ncbi:outer membrane lipoprotein carrier protein LolA [Formicincola oecophyllae]|uniref:Outer membrane lipoprotein carrier protein LolA n=2 Tax=Formicincola oecophyllae TaxID=2558361 RepID=A0A4Y6UBE6_9PROT|nr:outer membrane lipoprotein carrier protein LolA [Formicincola oecophyllae]
MAAGGPAWGAQAKPLSLVPGALQAPARQPAATPLTPVEKGWLRRLEDVLAATHTVKAHFVQQAWDGQNHQSTSTGTLWLERPGRMRFSYDPEPGKGDKKEAPVTITANDGKLVYIDPSIDQVTAMPLDHSPLGLLLRAQPRFSGDVTVTGFVMGPGQKRMAVALVRTAMPSAGTLTLQFNASPLQLLGWSVRDASGKTTSLSLEDVHTGMELPAGLFKLPRQAP